MVLFAPEPSGAPSDGLLSRWLEHLQNLDFESLLCLYHPQARLEGLSETVVGREEIAEVLQVHGRRLRGVRIAAVRALREAAEAADRLAFDTTLLGRFGAARLHHDWQVEDGLIRQHRVAVVHT